MLNEPTEDMVLFLELFTKELIIHSRTKNESQEIKERAVINKVQKEVKTTPLIASEFNTQEEASLNPPIYRKLIAEAGIKPEVNLPKITVPKEFKVAAQPKVFKLRKTMRHQRSFLGSSEKSEVEKNFSDIKRIPSRKIIPPQPLFQKTQRVTPKVQLKRNFTSQIKTKAIHLPSQIIVPVPGMEVNLGKLNILATDKGVTVIECPGPEKFVLVKKTGRTNLTQIKLSQEDINNIINEFSEKTRIPLMDGIFKAIIGEISINAIITDSICSRFMIYKKSPYSFLYQQ
ncbi:hypothetical protein A3K73_00970 [Candidatus Pacearchaeota archaeon RBG_13_36_9]|nr:MAG: hypothetical protein A3K73_00970 [Candidatus Pacearchaeota archaeon RBG_13_36_9]